MENSNNKDKWELALDKELKNLKLCQKSKSLTGCEKCQEILECNIRKNYVKAVYESMNKGTSGGFEF